MPKEINWEKITQLTSQQRAEMKAFVDKYGAAIEETLGIEISEDYVNKQIEENLENYQKAQNAAQASKHYDDLLKQYPTPNEAKNNGIFARLYRYYLTDDPQKNKDLQESLKSKDGQQALINRMVKDLMEMDLGEKLFPQGMGQTLDLIGADPKTQNIAFCSVLLYDATCGVKAPFPLEEPLKTAFADKTKLLEYGTSGMDALGYMTSPLGLLVPIRKGEEGLAFGNAFGQKFKGADPEARKIAGFINAAAMLEISDQRTPKFHEMEKQGVFANNVRLFKEDGTPIDMGHALEGMVDNKAYTVKVLDAATTAKLEKQLEDLPMAKNEIEENRLKQYQSKLAEKGLDIGTDVIADVMKSKPEEVKLIFGKGEIYPRRLQYDKASDRFKIGEPISERPKEPKKPNAFKRFLHGISSRLFKSEFNKYEKDMREHQKLYEAYDKVYIKSQNLWSNGRDANEEFRDRQNEAMEKQLDAENSFARQYSDRNLTEKESRIGLPEEQDGALRKKWESNESNFKKMPDGPIKKFGERYNGRLLSVTFMAQFAHDMTKDNPEAVRNCMAHQCVMDMVLSEHASRGDKDPGPLEQRLEKELSTAKHDSIIPMVAEVLNDPTFKKNTETIPLDRMINFFTSNSAAHKLNEAMANAAQAQKQKAENSKQLQNSKTVENKQPVASDPNHQMHGPQNSLGK